MKLMLTTVQQQAIDTVLNYRKTMEEIGGMLWRLAEIGLHEYRSAAYLEDIFRRNGFALTCGIAGFPTGFVAEYKNGEGPVLALLCEYDALPALSTVETGANGHGCGHNLFGAAAVSTALLLREIMEQHNIYGTLRVYGTPAEECFASKAYYVHQGLFDDVDCSVGFHAHDCNKVNYTGASGTLIKDYTFHGKPAHAGDYPWLGNSALDAVEIMNVACNYLREHVRPDVRIHYIITKGGDTVNVVPDLAASRYSVRSTSVPYMEEVSRRVDDCAKAAALATGCTVEVEYLDETYNTVLLREYAELAQCCLELVGPPHFSEEEQAAAHAFGNGTGLDTRINPLPATEEYQGGATDEGDVSWVVPHVSIYVANTAMGTPLHTLQSTQQMNMPAAYTAMETQVKATAVMLLDLLGNPKRIAEFKAAHAAKMGTLRYPKDPQRKLPPHVNPNCQGVTVEDSVITADFEALILLPQGYSGRVSFVLKGEAVAELAASGSAKAAKPLKSGDSLCVYCNDGGRQQLVGYYTVA